VLRLSGHHREELERAEGYKERSMIKQEDIRPEIYESTGAGGQVPSGHPYSSPIYGIG
jgi:hypothetical protein